MAGELWSELINPAELTGYARQAQADYEQSLGTLARWLPNNHIPDIIARFFKGRTGLIPVAQFRSYDAETPLGTQQGLQRVTIELPPIGQKNRIGEYDQLRQRDGDVANTVILNSLLTLTKNIVRSISDRIEVQRGQAIEFGETDIQDPGFYQNASWGRSSTHSTTVDWSDPDTSTPLLDLEAIRTQYLADTGSVFGSMVVSTKVLANLRRTRDFRNLFSTLAGTPSLVTRDSINQVLESEDLPPITVYDRIANVNGQVQRILSDNKMFLLPAAVDPNDAEGTQLGGTFWGTTLEADDPDYGIEAAEQPGIVAATWKTKDPIGVWVHANSIVLPVLANADLSWVLTVLPDGS